jgi:hypothetical protein
VLVSIIKNLHTELPNVKKPGWMEKNLTAVIETVVN